MPRTTNKNRETKTVDGFVTRYYDWAEIAGYYREFTAGESYDSSWDASGAVDRTLRDRERTWTGATCDEIIERLDGGYDLPALDGVATPASLEAEKARWRWTDNPEGEYQHDSFLNGEADYYVLRDRPGPKPGVNIEIEMTFNAGVDHETVGQYGTFVGQAIRAMQAQGYDVAVTLTSKARGQINGESKTDTHICVSRFGEIVFANDWSAIFSPGGYRHLFFCAYILPGLEQGQNVSSSLGSAAPNKTEFDIGFDRDSRTIKIDCDPNASTFPAAKLTDKLASLNID
jgi:hypothetical protein